MQKKKLLVSAIWAMCLHVEAQTLATDYKGASNGNPISPCVFCADPTAIEYEGRLYVYGTNDHQQYIKNGKTGSNNYGAIKSLVIFSTDDMVNWTFHGTIDVAKLCSSWGWRFAASWAPSIVSRETANGQQEFFLYFSNSGGSVGVLKSLSPLGPWRSPLSKPMIDDSTPGVKPCNWIFDPGVVIDTNGTGWIAFGGGDPQATGSAMWPGNSRIAKLKPSMTALDGSAVSLPAPYLFEASELNIMNGRFVYTYNTSWSDRNEWSSYTGRGTHAAPSACSMCYMVTDTPLNPDSWEYRGEYVPNEGNFGMGWGNNHTHLHKFEGTYYLFYHSTLLEQSMNSSGSGFRSIGVNKATVDESSQTISKMTLTKAGVKAIRTMNPYIQQQAETMATCGGVAYEDFTNITPATSISTLGNDASQNMQVNMKTGSWTMVRRVDFGTMGASQFTLFAKGTGRLEIRLGNKNAAAAAMVDFSLADMVQTTVEVDPAVFKGEKSVYFVFTAADNVQFDAWQFAELGASGISSHSMTEPATHRERYSLDGRRLSDYHSTNGIVIEQYIDALGKKQVRKQLSY